MTALHEALADYLALRRNLGYQLERPEKLLRQFLTFLATVGAERVSADQALAWACQSTGAERSNWPSQRLGVVRGFARYLQSIGVDAEVPPQDLLPWRPQRASPYLYTDQEIRSLIAAARHLRSPLRVATYQTLIGLLAVTGMRVGEALHLDCDDFDPEHGILTVRRAKFNKTRELPLHATAAAALAHYLARPDRVALRARCPALLVSPGGVRLRYCNVQWTFQRLVQAAGLRPRTRACRPRIHDLRHSFAVRTMAEAYAQGADAQQRLTVLATYLGHVNPAHTYWYLSASPELLGQVAARLDPSPGGVA